MTTGKGLNTCHPSRFRFLTLTSSVAPVNGTNVPSPTTTLAPASTNSTSSSTTKPTSSISATSTISSSSTYPSPPAPTVGGTTSQCNTWYTTVSGDTCGAIDTKYGISLAQFRAWNTFIDAACDNLYVGYSYCVSGPPVATSTTTTSTAASTPTPTQTGMVANCKKFYQAVSGDSCSAIATTYSISTSQFITWNPAVGSSCSTLYAGYYYCVSA
jgi:LysM repeat protein